MARRPNVPCADCGTLLWAGTGSLPPGEARCRPCRRSTPRTGPCGYGTAHSRVRRYRGTASEHDCARCDAQAEHWAYDHTDPDEIVERFPPDAPGRQPYDLVYSPDPARYLPLCRPCHRLFDLAYTRPARRET